MSVSRNSHRLTAALTGRAITRDLGPEAAHERNVLAITRTIHRGEARLRALLGDVKRLRRDLREKRRELRAVLQRDTTIMDKAHALELAGKSDATDRAIALAEQR